MPLIKNAIANTTDLASPRLYETSTHANMLQSVGFANMTGVLQQLAQLAHFSNEIFDDLFTVSKQLGQRLSTVQSRISKVNAQLASKQQTRGSVDFGNMNPSESTLDRTVQRRDTVQQQLFTPSSRDQSLVQKYKSCAPPPNLTLLDSYVETSNVLSTDELAHLANTSETKRGPCASKYSNPNYFFECWLEAEFNRQTKEKQRKEDRRKRRRKQKQQTRDSVVGHSSSGKDNKGKKKRESRSSLVKRIKVKHRDSRGQEFDGAAKSHRKTPTSRGSGTNARTTRERVSTHELMNLHMKKKSSRAMTTARGEVKNNGDPSQLPQTRRRAPAPAPPVVEVDEPSTPTPSVPVRRGIAAPTPNPTRAAPPPPVPTLSTLPTLPTPSAATQPAASRNTSRNTTTTSDTQFDRVESSSEEENEFLSENEFSSSEENDDTPPAPNPRRHARQAPAPPVDVAANTPNPNLVKYQRMLKAGVPLPAVQGKMQQEGMSESDIIAVTGSTASSTAGNTAGNTAAPTKESTKVPTMVPTDAPRPTPSSTTATTNPKLVKYHRMLKAGVPLPAVQGKMRQEGMSESDITAVTGVDSAASTAPKAVRRTPVSADSGSSTSASAPTSNAARAPPAGVRNLLADVQNFKKNKLKKKSTADAAANKPAPAPRNGLLAAIRNKGASGLKKINRKELEEKRKSERSNGNPGGIAGGMMSGIAAIMARRTQIKGHRSDDSDSSEEDSDWEDDD